MSIPSEDGAEAVAVGKVFRHLIFFMFVLYLCSYLDRINIGFAALSMNKQLGLNAAAFGVASTAFYIPYILAEIPSNLLMVRAGARRWIGRIMISWGIASAATIFASSATSLYWLRALVGLAEAGFMPGMMLYISLWFPLSHRGRAMSWFMMAMPATTIIAGPVSGALLQLDGALGLRGWQWLFLAEAIPAVVLGVLVLFRLPDAPRDAGWLTEADKAALARAISRDAPAAPQQSRATGLASPMVLLFCLSYFGLVTSLNTFATWSPLVMKAIFGPNTNSLSIGLLAAIPAVLTILGMGYAGAASDRSRAQTDRFWQTIALFGLTALGWATIIFATAPALRFAGLAMVSVGAFSAMALFWALVSALMPAQVRAAGLALVSMCGLVGSALSPLVIGLLRDRFGSFDSGLWYSIALLVIGAVALALAGRSGQNKLQVEPSILFSGK